MSGKRCTYTMAQLQTDVEWLKTQLANHLAHHWAVTLCLLGIAATEAAALVMFIVKLHIST